jgi:hypothetical protein
VADYVSLPRMSLHILSGDITIGMLEIDIVLPLLELYDGILPEDTAATG